MNEPSMSENNDGDVVVDFGGDSTDLTSQDGQSEISSMQMEHHSNIAEHLGSHELSSLATDILSFYESDVESRSAWEEIHKIGMKLLGLTSFEKDILGNDGSTKCIHPAMMEAIINFQSRTSAEMLPPKGPVKPNVEGSNPSEEDMRKAERVAQYMNYRLTKQDKSYIPSQDRSFFQIPFYGCTFDKVCIDRRIGVHTIKSIDPLSVVFAYAKSFEEAPRVTHKIELFGYEYKALIESGVYMDVPIDTFSTPAQSDAEDERDEAVGLERPGTAYLSGDPDTQSSIFLEMRITMKLPDEIDGGEHLPYIVTLIEETQQIVSIYRNWEPDDESRAPIVDIVIKPFVPGFGGYPFGLPHLYAGAVAAANDSMNLIIGGGAFASMQGGFKTKEGSSVSGNVTLEAGVYKEIDASYDEMSKAFYTPPFKEPSPALFSMWQALLSDSRRAMFNTDLQAGEGRNTGPVGTTMALIEQAGITPSSIHRRLHNANAHLFEILYNWISKRESIPVDGYPYDIGRDDVVIYASDFDGAPNICPVSDPNIFSNTQRMALAQAVVDRSSIKPTLYRQYMAEKKFLEAMRVPSPDAYLIDPGASMKERNDPITENAMALMGQGLTAKEDEPHDAHYAAHMARLQQLAVAKSPLLQIAQPILMGHAAQHLALGMRQKFAAASGVPAAPMKYDPETGRWSSPQPQIPPQAEAQIAMAMAQWEQQQLQQLMQMAQAQQQGQGGAQDPKVQAEAEKAKIQGAAVAQKMGLEKTAAEDRIARDQREADAEEMRKQRAFEAEERRKDMAAENAARRAMADQRTRERLSSRESDSKVQRADAESNTKQAISVANAQHEAGQVEKSAQTQEDLITPIQKSIDQILERISKIDQPKDEQPVIVNTGPVVQHLDAGGESVGEEGKSVKAKAKANDDGTMNVKADGFSAVVSIGEDGEINVVAQRDGDKGE